MLHGCPPSPDAWGRLNVVTTFHHLSGDSHINSSLREGPLRHLTSHRVLGGLTLRLNHTTRSRDDLAVRPLRVEQGLGGLTDVACGPLILIETLSLDGLSDEFPRGVHGQGHNRVVSLP